VTDQNTSQLMDARTETSPPLTDAWLQQFIDTAKPDNGVIRVPAGRYLLHDSIRLRSNIHLVADGEVILEKVPSVRSPLIDIVGYGHSEFRVADPHLFRPGMGVLFTAGPAVGFGVTVARIVEQDGDTFFTDTPFHRDYRPSDNATVWTMFPLVAGYDVENVRLSGFIIDGGGNDPGHLDGCRGGGVYLLGCRNIEMDGLEVRGYHGDGISFQQCVDLWIRNCDIHHNTGNGLHPGSGSVRYVMTGNRVHHNGNNGVYYCLRTTHSICSDNQIHDNASAGISVGERDNDHLIENNTIQDNGKAGLWVRPPVVTGGDRLLVRGNRFAGNWKSGEGAEVEIEPRIRSVHLIDNSFETTRTPTIRVGAQCEDIVITGNVRGGQPLAAEQVKAESAIRTTLPERELPVGPAALPLNGARHLRIGRLTPWQDRPQEASAETAGAHRGLANVAGRG